VYLSAGRIDALLLCRGRLLRTSDPSRTRFGLAQVRRELAHGDLHAVHVVFAPDAGRPLLLGLARLHNAGDAPLALEYTETWAVSGSDHRAAAGACELRTAEGVCALADVSLAVRAFPLDPPPDEGLALALRLLLPPHSVRELYFAYAAPGPGDPPAALVRAWRGRVPDELVRSVRAWHERLGGVADPLAAYRLQAGRPG
jgi:hypothetical protein